jgi:hypothetical protein
MRKLNHNNHDLLLRGSLVRLRTKCGKPNCRCARGDRHECYALSYSVHGVTSLFAVRSQDAHEIRAALGRYKKARRDLEQQALAGIRALRTRLRKERARAHGRNV